jgi:6-phosphogluconolactonase
MKYKVLVGSYTNAEHENGINLFEFNSSSAKLELLNSFKIENASFFCAGLDTDVLYTVNENHTACDKISALSIDRDSNTITLLNQQSSGGIDPCYITVDSQIRHVFTANYSDGCLSVTMLNDDKTLNEVSQIIKHPIPRDDAYHANTHMHAAVLSPDEGFLLAANLGLDTISVYAYDPKTETNPLNPEAFGILRFPDGTGPRHLVFSANGQYVYVVGELDGSLHLLTWDSGRLKIIQSCKLMDEVHEGMNSAAEIQLSPNGKFVYVSNRAEVNQIVTYRVLGDGFLRYVGRTPAGGRSPRNFTLDPEGKYMLVANQHSNHIAYFGIDADSGLPTEYLGQYEIHSPVFIRFI